MEPARIKTTITFGGARQIMDSPSARLSRHPMVKRIGNGKGEIFLAPTFLTQDGCERLIGLIDRDRRPSTLADSNGDYKFRTSETCDMRNDNPVVADVRNSICALLGIEPKYAETLQGQRYDVGGEFKLHCDWFRPESDDYVKYCAVAGQRTWTAMVYLDDVPEGGHTLFPHLDIDMKPARGNMLLWNNLRPDGSVNPMTGHHATPVIRGRKNVITLWFRERPWG